MYLLFIIVASSVSWAQQDSIVNTIHGKCSVSLSGKVLDGETNSPLEAAFIQVKGTSIAIYTDENGYFEITGICGNKYEVICSRLGYKTLVVKLNLVHNTAWNFILHSDDCEMESVVVIGKKKDEHVAQSTVTLSGNELDRNRGGSLGELVQNLPGVSAIQSGPTVFKPVIQGMYGQRVLIMNNGIRQEGQQWGSEHAPEVDPFVANKLTVVKGAAAVRYGSDAIGGVILVDPKPLRKEAGLGGALYLGGFSNSRGGVSSAMIEYAPKKIPGLSGRIQGTFRKQGYTKTPNYYLKNTAAEEYNFSYALGYQKRKAGVEVYYSQFNTKLGILSAAHIGNLTDLQRAIASPVPLETAPFSYAIDRPFQQVVHELFKASAYLKSSAGDKLSVQYSLQYNNRKEYDKHTSRNDSVAAANNPELELHITTQTATLIFEHRTIKNCSGTIGLTGVQQGNIFKGRFFIPNFISYAGGVFWIEQWNKNKWTVEAGLRYDYKWMQVFYFKNKVYQNPEFNFGNTSASIGLAHQTTKHFLWRATIGSGFRPPHVSELFSNGVHHGAAAVEIGDENLKSERALNYSLSAHIASGKFNSEISAYYSSIDNYIYLAPVFPATLTIRGAFPTFRYSQVDASFTGLDIWMSDSLNKHFTFTSKASIVKAYNVSAKEPLIMTPPARFENGISYILVRGKKWTDPFVGLSNTLVLRKTQLPDNSDYAEAPKGYSLWNAQAGVERKMKKQTLALSVNVVNIFNVAYRDYLDRFRYYADAAGRNIIVRIKMTF